MRRLFALLLILITIYCTFSLITNAQTTNLPNIQTNQNPKSNDFSISITLSGAAIIGFSIQIYNSYKKDRLYEKMIDSNNSNIDKILASNKDDRDLLFKKHGEVIEQLGYLDKRRERNAVKIENLENIYPTIQGNVNKLEKRVIKICGKHNEIHPDKPLDLTQ
ncbi:hypothetical protein M0R01_03815 [bacterium]|nr:hypothetical protein [bacterium]